MKTTELRIVLASPNDVRTERDTVEEVVAEINEGIVAAEFGYRLRVYRWETDVAPQFHADGAQAAIDRALQPHDCDILIGIFWTRFGTPGPDGKTGTEHEIELAHESWRRHKRPQIMLYFKRAPIMPEALDDVDQLRRVLAFKSSSLFQEALYGEFTDVDAFRRLLRNHLIQHIRDAASGIPAQRRGHPEEPAPIHDWQRIKAMLHTFSGLKPETRDDEVFQDFRIDSEDNPNAVTHLWAEVYRGCSINAWIEEGEPPELHVVFDNKPPDSWPSNITIRPRGEQAVAKGNRTKLVFDARVVADAGALSDIDIAVRVVNGWYQHWSYGNAGSYRMLHANEQWKTFTVSLEDRSDCWWWFKSDGNKYYGPEHPDLTTLAGVVLEFGGKKKDRPGPGRGTIAIRNIRLE